ncbi:helix-turn-helix transcriptional regulator [Limosilactobacillus fermentum]|uniref:Helix-turn-helix transcriptional regulator n=4 Tax=Limosilactobacillus fermentum TaxID=1613 RepID=A0AAJ6D1E1_LIMFE|nr:helix-turn-helix transcriptional regulator [Limosilactobacillus fermentum]UVW04563.1 helix-turn-helix domain-containing protein [Limosilactobacillus fermentum]WEN06476.1 helix-turn-helix transcriptional regulator [Limosilactobacillus fermentum]WEN13332.1 helix-turn-helix transcriptional regulator [Limosilactobacillus fermentum]WFR90126.1 helix-turn-helix transcriptional regulator [Limosilactobacillus fermentum]WJD39987.1 helix-turn-helix transcriptional regulator [Limosilactobacillus fermen
MLGKYIGVSQTTVTAWETNRTEPSSTYVTKLAELFGQVQNVGVN